MVLARARVGPRVLARARTVVARVIARARVTSMARIKVRVMAGLWF